ncbi:MAG: hypothetical protein LBG52_06980 [Candidatus Peribacteria bacterium]|jgi:hypothetical protein|nr:hypothetical protein [Candidatus Peribacteria bacterium]
MEAKSMADKVVDDMGATAESVVAQQIGKASGKIENVLALEVMNEIRAQMEKQIDKALNYVSTLSISGTVNTGLGSTREAYADMMY